MHDGGFSQTYFSNRPQLDKTGPLIEYQKLPQCVGFNGPRRRGEEGMNKKDLKKIKDILLERRQALLQGRESINEQSVVFSTDDLPDEVDLATSETDQAVNLKLRDRERFLIRKIDKALQKIENGDYGDCESCGDPIGMKRLMARPVTDLCIRCKEEQEARERVFAED
jgi:DnaK suppressor protein